MRVLSVVTLVSPDGAYGGPLRVALNQAGELLRRGHEVTLVAAQRGYGPQAAPTEMAGVPLHLFPARRLAPRTGFAGLSSPGLLRYLRSHARDFDVAHVHVARDLVTLPAALVLRRAGVPYVLQCHGMIDASPRLLARVVDPLLTRPVLRHARSVFALTDRERADLDVVAPGLDTVDLPNGVPETELRADPATPEVLYLARLAARKRPGVMVELADALVAEFPGLRFRLVGPDEGEGPAVEAAAAASTADVVWEGPLAPSQTAERMSRAGVYVLPAVDEPYPMSVLEAMSLGLPVLITKRCGLASTVRRTGAGVVTDESVEALTAGLRSILADPSRAAAMSRAGRAAVATELGMAGVVETLERTYLKATTSVAVGGPGAGTRP